MGKLRLSLGCDRYDHLQPLIDRSVTPDGIDLKIVTIVGGERHDQMMRGEFDLAEFSLGSYLAAVDKGKPLSAIPVFVRRMFGHRYALINTASGIASPQDLRGKKIGIKRYSNTLSLWFRGLLQHFYGVHPQAVHWFSYSPEIVDVTQPPGLSVTPMKKGADLARMLMEGELDGVVYPEGSEILGCWKIKSPRIKRLFPDVKRVEREYFEATGDFPIMHLIVGRRDLFESQAWIAQSLYNAFERARDVWFEKMESPTFVSLAWGSLELEEEKKVMGEARWPYGVEPNRRSLERMIQYAVEQGFLSAPIPLEKLFCPLTSGRST